MRQPLSFLSLLFKQLLPVFDYRPIFKIIDPHSPLNSCQSFICDLPGLCTAGKRDIIYTIDILLPLRTACAYRGKSLLKNIDQELLAGAVTETASHVVRLHLIQILIIRQILCKMLIPAKRVKICEHYIAFKMTRILDLLKKHNIESKDITTTALNFSTDYYWEDGKQIKAGESVSQTVYVTMKNIAEFAALADDIGTQLTGISFYNVSFDSTQKVVAGNTARELAYQNAFEKASLYAKQAGLEVVRPVSISEGYASFATANYKRAYAEDAVATMAAAPVPETYGTQMPTGLLSASVDVNITFELK